jgi:hypothetical protein
MELEVEMSRLVPLSILSLDAVRWLCMYLYEQTKREVGKRARVDARSLVPRENASGSSVLLVGVDVNA